MLIGWFWHLLSCDRSKVRRKAQRTAKLHGCAVESKRSSRVDKGTITTRWRDVWFNRNRARTRGRAERWVVQVTAWRKMQRHRRVGPGAAQHSSLEGRNGNGSAEHEAARLKEAELHDRSRHPG